MSDAVSALPGATFEGAVAIEEAGLRGMITLKGDLSSKKLRSVCTGLTGTAFPEQGDANTEGEKGLCWMAPDELLVLVPHSETATALEKIADALKSEHHLAANVSDARVVFRITGLSTRNVLAKLTPADVSQKALAPGQMRRTRLAQVPAAFWLTDDTTAHLIAFRSVAQYVHDLLTIAADPLAQVDYH